VLASDEAVPAGHQAVLASDEAVPAGHQAVLASDEAVPAGQQTVPARDEAIAAGGMPASATVAPRESGESAGRTWSRTGTPWQAGSADQAGNSSS
jgi:hypothetical protein